MFIIWCFQIVFYVFLLDLKKTEIRRIISDFLSWNLETCWWRHLTKQSFIWLDRTLRFFVATNSVVVIFTIQNKFAYWVLIFYLQEKRFLWWRQIIAVTGCLLRDGMSMGKVTKVFSYSFSMFHVSHSSVEGGTGKISDWIIEAKYFKWEHFSYEFLLREKYLFISNNYIW